MTGSQQELRQQLGNPEAGTVWVRRIEELAAQLERRVTLMEVCGTHTHAIAAAGLRRLMPSNIRLVSGPGCPVCVTPIAWVDRAMALAKLPGTILTTFGDMMRVPASRGTLESARAEGADVRICYSTREALQVARDHPDHRVIFLAVGFETTAPTIAAALLEAERDGVGNFQILAGHKTMPQALLALGEEDSISLDGLICPGHVSVIIGSEAYQPIAQAGLPCSVVGFAPNDVLQGIADLLQQVQGGESRVSNLYRRVVQPQGNVQAQAVLERYFQPADVEWRGLGVIPGSGLELREEFAHRDASRIEVERVESREPKGCRCGEVLQGAIDPPDCPLFGNGCDPEHAVGACMVSSEGTCAAWYRHERLACLQVSGGGGAKR